MKEKINHPQHYGGDTTYEHIKVVRAWGLGYNLGIATKHICRAGKKEGETRLDDLRKARWYINDEIEFEEKQAALPQAPECGSVKIYSPTEDVHWAENSRSFADFDHAEDWMRLVGIEWDNVNMETTLIRRYIDASGGFVARGAMVRGAGVLLVLTETVESQLIP